MTDDASAGMDRMQTASVKTPLETPQLIWRDVSSGPMPTQSTDAAAIPPLVLDVRATLDDPMAGDLIRALRTPGARAIVSCVGLGWTLRSSSKVVCGGSDIVWRQEASMAHLLAELQGSRQCTIAMCQGGVYDNLLLLASAHRWTLAHGDAAFGFPRVGREEAAAVAAQAAALRIASRAVQWLLCTGASICASQACAPRRAPFALIATFLPASHPILLPLAYGRLRVVHTRLRRICPVPQPACTRVCDVHTHACAAVRSCGRRSGLGSSISSFAKPAWSWSLRA